MKLYFKFFSYFIALLLLIVASYSYLWKVKGEELTSINKLRIEEFKHIFHQIVELKTVRSKLYAYDYSYWDEMIEFTTSKDKEWAIINITDTIKTFESDYVLIIDSHSNIIYKEFADASFEDISSLLDKKDFNFDKPTFHDYFIKTTKYPIQVFIAPIQNSADIKRSSKPRGYMVVGKVWDDKFIKSLSNISRANISLKPNNQNTFDINNKLHGSNGQVLYTLGIMINKNSNELLDNIFSSQLLFLSSLAILILILLTIFIYKQILNPLKNIYLAMQQSNPKKLETLRQKNNEFGQIANLIYQFFIQKYELQNMNSILETKVQVRTQELESINKSLDERIKIEVEARRQQDEILFRQMKLAGMGEMIGNIAHQWRQPLSVISTIATGLKMRLEFNNLDEKEAMADLDDLNKSAQYLSQTIDDFRNFFKPDKEKSTFSLNETFDKTFSLLKHKLQNLYITLIFEKKEDIKILGFQNELTQSLINILNNATDALEDNKIENKYIFIDYKKYNNKIIISIQDNAGGIADNIIDRIFEPYFTTKHQSVGTGLGLYMTEEIIVKHFDGAINVVNKEFIHNGHKYIGAYFSIELPLEPTGIL